MCALDRLVPGGSGVERTAPIWHLPFPKTELKRNTGGIRRVLEAMTISAQDRQALSVFLSALVLFTSAAYVPMLSASPLFDSIRPFAVPLIMWSPGVAGILTSLVVYRSLMPCGFALRGRAWLWIVAAFVVPLLYAIAVYLPLAALDVVELGRSNLTGQFVVIGFLQSMLFAVGEEIGWRGFFAPLMMRRFGFVRGNALVGAAWALFHFPAILFSDYGGSESPLWFGLLAFSITVVLLSIFLGELRAASKSLWPAAVFHAAHNLFFLHLFDPMTKTSPAASWLVGELGILLTIVTAVLAGVAIARQRRNAVSGR